MSELPDFDRLVLGAVSILGDGATGKAIKECVGGVTSYSAIYMALGELRRKGLVRVGDTVPLLYSITDAGRYALAGEVE